MKQQLTQLIPTAIQAVRAVRIPVNKSINGNSVESVSSQYHGYISSLGAGIVQAGLLPAVIFFENSEGEEKKYKITQAIYWLIRQGEIPGFEFNGNPKASVLSDYMLENNLQSDPVFLKKVTQNAVALKIALRTFYKEKK